MEFLGGWDQIRKFFKSNLQLFVIFNFSKMYIILSDLLHCMGMKFSKGNFSVNMSNMVAYKKMILKLHNLNYLPTPIQQ